MTLTEKIDAVFKCLFDYSGYNPDLKFIMDKLKHLEIDVGEVRDILIKLIKDGFVYCEINGQIGTIFYDNARYLISFEGKFFHETVGSFAEKNRLSDFENNHLKTLEAYQRKQNEKLTCLTLWIAVGTCVAAAYYLVEMVKRFFSK